MSINKKIVSILLLILALTSCEKQTKAQEGGNMKITSPEFENGKFIPKKFSCQGQGVNPALIIEDVPKQAKSLALIVDDPDAPMGTFVHWVVYDIPVMSKIQENSVPGKQGINTTGRKNYVPPCPPTGAHRYYFKLYALDALLDLNEGMKLDELESAMQGHVLEKAELMGLYKKSGN